MAIKLLLGVATVVVLAFQILVIAAIVIIKVVVDIKVVVAATLAILTFGIIRVAAITTRILAHAILIAVIMAAATALHF